MLTEHRSAARRASATGRQDPRALAKNARWFADNDDYRNTQHELEFYRLIALAAAHETERTRSLLDIGNGGLFAYPIVHIPRVVAIDLFVEGDFRKRYPGVEWLQMSALEMQFDRPFDTAIAVNTLHHIVGSSVKATEANLDTFMRRSEACLVPGGRFIVIESTMPRWFVALYGLAFPLVLKLWPLSHPPTFQFHFRQILRAAERAGLILREFTWIPKTSDFVFLGFRIKRWMAPIRVAKFVFEAR